jgi:hypothetical protein
MKTVDATRTAGGTIHLTPSPVVAPEHRMTNGACGRLSAATALVQV